MSTPTDPEAPYGRLGNGKPRKTPPPGAPKAQRKPTKAPDYRPGIKGAVQVICMPLAFFLPADAYTIQTYVEGSPGRPGIADALNELAQDRPEVAAMLDRVLQAGPYGALLGAVVPMLVQLAHNHDLIPEQVAVQLGATPKSVIMDHLRQAGAPTHKADRRPGPGTAGPAPTAPEPARAAT